MPTTPTGTGKKDIPIPQRADWTWRFYYRNRATGAIIPITGLSWARLQVRETPDSETAFFTLTLGSGITLADGILTIRAPAASTTGLTKSGFFDLLLGFDDGAVVRAIEGKAPLSKGVTRAV